METNSEFSQTPDPFGAAPRHWVLPELKTDPLRLHSELAERASDSAPKAAELVSTSERESGPELVDTALTSEAPVGAPGESVRVEAESHDLGDAAFEHAAFDQPAPAFDEPAFDEPAFIEPGLDTPLSDAPAPPLAEEVVSGVPTALLGTGLAVPYEEPSAAPQQNQDSTSVPPLNESLRSELLIEDSDESEKPSPEPVGTTRRSFQGVAACAVFTIAGFIMISGGRSAPDTSAAPAALALSAEPLEAKYIPEGVTALSQDFATLDEDLQELPEPVELLRMESDTGSVLVFRYEIAGEAVSATQTLQNQGYEVSDELLSGSDYSAMRSGRFLLMFPPDSNRTFLALIAEHVRLL